MRTEGRTDRGTDMTKLTVAFRNFANAPTNYYLLHMVFCFFIRRRQNINQNNVTSTVQHNYMFLETIHVSD